MATHSAGTPIVLPLEYPAWGAGDLAAIVSTERDDELSSMHASVHHVHYNLLRLLGDLTCHNLPGTGDIITEHLRWCITQLDMLMVALEGEMKRRGYY